MRGSCATERSTADFVGNGHYKQIISLPGELRKLELKIVKWSRLWRSGPNHTGHTRVFSYDRVENQIYPKKTWVGCEILRYDRYDSQIDVPCPPRESTVQMLKNYLSERLQGCTIIKSGLVWRFNPESVRGQSVNRSGLTAKWAFPDVDS